MSSSCRVRVVVAALLVVTSILSTAGLAGSVVGPATGASAVTAQNDTDANGTEVRHADPDNRSQDGDLAQVQRWLSGRMGQVLIDCTEGVSIGNYDACDQMNRSYPEYLEKYVDVTGRTTNTTDDETADSFADARDDQENFTDTVREFRETHEEYEEAREEGDTERARRLARRLRSLQQNASQTRSDLIADYYVITNRTQANHTASATTVNGTIQGLSGTVDEIERDLFVATDITAAVDDERISFTDPLVVTGEVDAADDSDVSNGTVVLFADGRRIETEVNEDGTYHLTYQPTTIPTGERNFTVGYDPPPSSEYLPARTFIESTVEQVQPTVTITDAPDDVQYNDSVAITGQLAVEGEGAASVPVVLQVGGQPVARGMTTEDGTFTFETALPAAIPAGEQTLQVAQPASGRALAPAAAAREVTVASTSTALSLDATAADDGQVQVRGKLTTGEGEPVSGQSVAIHIGETLAKTVTTGPNGQYQTTVAVPDEENAASEPIPIRAQFDGAQTNLESAGATTTVLLEADGANVGPGADGELLDRLRSLSPLWIGVILAGLLLVAVVLATGYVRDWDWLPLGGDSGTDTAMEGTGTAESVAGETGEEASMPPFERLLAQANRVEDEQPQQAIEMAYASVRAHFAATDEQAQTHWEFYRTTVDELDDDRRSALERLTELYERVSFAGAPSSTTDADRAIDAASVLTERTTRADGGEADGAQTDDTPNA